MTGCDDAPICDHRRRESLTVTTRERWTRWLAGAVITPAMTGGTYTVNGTDVVCGNVQTSNATVYIISSVLMPSS